LALKLDFELLENRNYMLKFVSLTVFVLSLALTTFRVSAGWLLNPCFIFSRAEGTSLRPSNYTINDFLGISWGGTIGAYHILTFEMKRTFSK
jgi:hypothetical protein